MPDTPAFPLVILYDGACPVCAVEADVYRRKDLAGRLRFCDMAAPGFDPAPYGITLDELMREMHAIDRTGRVYRGVDAFRAIWLAFPDSAWYRLLSTLVALPGVHLLSRLAYRGFARIRVYWPKRHNACKGSICHPPSR